MLYGPSYIRVHTEFKQRKLQDMKKLGKERERVIICDGRAEGEASSYSFMGQGSKRSGKWCAEEIQEGKYWCLESLILQVGLWGSK